jgi:uncharacterized protein YqhQ
MSESKPYIGGQAVIEGVMMRGPACVTVAVRRPDGTIAVKEGPLASKLAASKLWKLPGLRGVATLVESLSLGFRALRFSAEQQMTEEERAAAKNGGGGGGWAMLISILLAIAIFKAAPQYLADAASWVFGFELGVQNPLFHLLTGGFQLLVLLGYLFLIGRLPDVKRVFQYHGAEHKTIAAYEEGLPLTLENVRKQSTLHPRCGTTFLVIVVVISIVVGSVTVPLILPGAEGWLGKLQTLGLRIALLPVIAAISYELQRVTARYCTTGPLRAVLWPGFLFQKITTREPDDRQIEIAIAAMRTAVWREEVGKTIPADDTPLVFPSFEGFVGALPALRPVPVAAPAPAAA